MKIKPRIISMISNGKPYYEIKYYDTVLKDTCIGYGSFNKRYVEEWLKQDFPKIKRIKKGRVK